MVGKNACAESQACAGFPVKPVKRCAKRTAGKCGYTAERCPAACASRLDRQIPFLPRCWRKCAPVWSAPGERGIEAAGNGRRQWNCEGALRKTLLRQARAVLEEQFAFIRRLGHESGLLDSGWRGNGLRRNCHVLYDEEQIAAGCAPYKGMEADISSRHVGRGKRSGYAGGSMPCQDEKRFCACSFAVAICEEAHASLTALLSLRAYVSCAKCVRKRFATSRTRKPRFLKVDG